MRNEFSGIFPSRLIPYQKMAQGENFFSKHPLASYGEMGKN